MDLDALDEHTDEHTSHTHITHHTSHITHHTSHTHTHHTSHITHHTSHTKKSGRCLHAFKCSIFTSISIYIYLHPSIHPSVQPPDGVLPALLGLGPFGVGLFEDRSLVATCRTGGLGVGGCRILLVIVTFWDTWMILGIWGVSSSSRGVPPCRWMENRKIHPKFG